LTTNVVRNAAREKMLQRDTRANRNEYRAKRNAERKLLRRKKRKIEEDLIADINRSNVERDVRKLYQQVRAMRSGYQQQAFMCKDADGNILTEETLCIERWTHYYRNLLNNDNTTETHEENRKVFYTAQPWIEEPSIDEVIAAIRRIKNNKSPGTDNIPGDFF